jgi:tetratricopeptide (TPR) repeat protein
MERRAVLLKCLGGTAATLLPSSSLPAPAPNSTKQFYELWEQTCLCHYSFEDKRAYDLCLRTWALAPKNLDNNFRADIVEKLGHLREALSAAEEELRKQREALRDDPHNPEKHFYLAFTLTRLGREEEAMAEYRVALEKPQDINGGRLRDLRNDIGWYYYRQGHYHEALKWFDRAFERADCSNFLGQADAAKAMENKTLTLVALGRAQEARETARNYVERFGRLPWPVCHALAKLGIDGDVIYLELHYPEV